MTLPNHPSHLSRRKFLAVAASVPALTVSDGIFTKASASEHEKFLHLSSELTGFPVSDLNTSRANTLLGLLMNSNYKQQLILSLDAPSAQTDEELVEVIITFWYAGIIAIDGDFSVDTYTDAFMWKSAWFASPKSVCVSVPNGWSLPPSATEG